MDSRELAEKIAEDLFTNGFGEKATRLVLIIDGTGFIPPRDLGGRNRQSVTEVIERHLKENAHG